ncbi:hypothetical protein B0H66DRAFT_109267 [Apodospora peruviana]|uniref:Thymidylate kinase n=1 Tax=Apodospora peruviana TaxID=516989 RepID=A0AAE0MAZ4_9PEZI|nr:hypothetical protein B0H66DRAFT_109267 [Apodospora peruviana]
MATFTRQPFAPLDGARLQSLTSLKNRQNALIPSPSSIKRKASEVDTDDFENVDPSSLFSKRSKGSDSTDSFGGKELFKSPGGGNFVLTKAAPLATSTPISNDVKLSSSSTGGVAASRPRTILQPKSSVAKLNALNTRITSSPLTAPAGRSPTRGSKRIGILGRRRTAQRVEPPPTFGFGSAAAPFSLDAALKGTIPSYKAAAAPKAQLKPADEMKSSWFFDIHEDTPEQEMTNLLQHSTCTLDISSDEESEQRASRERAEGRDKENIPPADDVSQTSGLAAAARAACGDAFNDMVVDKMRGPLVEMNAADYYAAGCDDSSVCIVHDDEDYELVVEAVPPQQEEEVPVPEEKLVEDTFEFAPKVTLPDVAVSSVNVDVIMGKDEPAAKAAVLEPIEGTGESFDLWESGSARDDVASQPGSPAPTSGPADGDAAVAALPVTEEVVTTVA